jgi:hypothetical protein
MKSWGLFTQSFSQSSGSKSLLKFAGLCVLALALNGNHNSWAQIRLLPESTNGDSGLHAVPLIRGFIPAQGFDDNDPNIEFVAHGHLPNSCYRLAGYRLQRGTSGAPEHISVYANKIQTGACAETVSLPPDLMTVVPFTISLSLGRLPAGNYRLAYDRVTEQGHVVSDSRVFTVEVAQTQDVDNFRYASVQGVHVASIYRSGSIVRGLLSVTLTSSCTELADVEVSRQGDVIVLLPRLWVRENTLCTQEMRSVDRGIEIPDLADGTYLLHVRSNGGQAENRVFSLVNRSR